MFRHVILVLWITAWPMFAQADEPLPWQSPKAAPAAPVAEAAAAPAARFFPINPAVYMRPPMPQYVESINPARPPLVQPSPPTAVAKPGSGLSEEQARQLLSIYAN